MRLRIDLALVLLSLHRQSAQESGSNGEQDGVNATEAGDDVTNPDDDNDDLLFGNETLFPSVSPTSTWEPTIFSESDIEFPDTEEPDIDVPPESEEQSRPPLIECSSMNIFTKADCQFSCLGFPFTVRYNTIEMIEATGAIQKLLQGFQCQCLQAVPPVDCIFHHDFRSCQEMGIVDCRLESFPAEAASIERDGQKKSDSTNTSSSTSIGDGATLEANTTASTSVTDPTSCAVLCRDLGFDENSDDVNGNPYDSLCTRNDINQWTSCACGVVITIDGGRSVDITDGMFVCGDDGYEEGLAFEALSEGCTSTKWRSIRIGICLVSIGILLLSNV